MPIVCAGRIEQQPTESGTHIVAFAIVVPPRGRFRRLRNFIFRLRHPRGGTDYKRVSVR